MQGISECLLHLFLPQNTRRVRHQSRDLVMQTIMGQFSTYLYWTSVPIIIKQALALLIWHDIWE